jgi:hypothetical protein
VYFHEVYENSSGVTQVVNAYNTTIGLRYVNAKGDGTSFAEYVLHDNTCLIANKTLRNNVVKFFSNPALEQNLVFYSEYANLVVYYSKDGGAYSQISIFPLGYGVIPLSTVELMSGVTSNLRIYLEGVNTLGLPVTVSEVITIYVDSTCNEARTVLEFDGLVGGKEYLAFEGMKNTEFTTVRNYRTGANKNRKPLAFFGICRQKLETRFKDMANAEYLKSLLISDTVKKLNPSLALPTDVTVLTENVRITNSEMFTNQIDIEYEY